MRLKRKRGGLVLHKLKTNKPEMKDSLEKEVVQSTDETFAKQSLNQNVGKRFWDGFWNKVDR